MTSDTNGFRSLVEQIQAREKETTIAREPVRERPVRKDTPPPADRPATKPTATGKPELLRHRWL